MKLSTKLVTKSRRDRSGKITRSRDVVGWVRLGETVRTTSRTVKGRGVEKAQREVRAWLRNAVREHEAASRRKRARRKRGA
jgi:hypothetical protein